MSRMKTTLLSGLSLLLLIGVALCTPGITASPGAVTHRVDFDDRAPDVGKFCGGGSSRCRQHGESHPFFPPVLLSRHVLESKQRNVLRWISCTGAGGAEQWRHALIKESDRQTWPFPRFPDNVTKRESKMKEKKTMSSSLMVYSLCETQFETFLWKFYQEHQSFFLWQTHFCLQNECILFLDCYRNWGSI